MKGSLVLAAVAAAILWPQAAAAAPWCGSVGTADRPAVVGGQHVRVLYALPSDGADRSGEIAPRISADVDEIDAWWRANDSARTLRFDVFPFPCGLQADLMLLRLGRSAAELTANETRFDQIAADPAVDRLFDGFTKLLVYYDGPVSGANLCGQGGGAAEGDGIAIVYLAACGEISRAAIGAHELLHAMGALPGSGPPNACPNDRGHVCDSSGDILYPFAQRAPLSSLVLDLNRNDYYGHGQQWLDVRSSPWLRHLDAQVPLTVNVSGGGSVTSTAPGFAGCASSCRAEFNRGVTVALDAAPAAGQRFVSWSGACAGASTFCALGLDGEQAVTATFAPAAFRLTVSVRGSGRVTSAVGISCPSRCARDVESLKPVVLRAAPAKGWKLKAWSGACRGAKATCTVPMAAAASARATFVKLPVKKKRR